MADNEAPGEAGPPFHQPPAPTTKPSAGILFRPTVALIIVALTTTLSLACLLLRLYAKTSRRHSPSSSTDTPAYGPAAEHEQRISGVERAVIDSLPFFRFGSLRGEKQEGAECAVCLARFDAAELLRLLPKCRHAFHVGCVDAWLESHSTCPLCRSRVDPEDALLFCGGTDHQDRPQSSSSAGEGSSTTSSGGVLPAAGERQRKDGSLLAVERFAGGEGMRERWSDLRPGDLMFLRLELLGRSTVGARRSESEGVLGRRAEEERTMQKKWLGFAAERAGGWPGGGRYGGG